MFTDVTPHFACLENFTLIRNRLYAAVHFVSFSLRPSEPLLTVSFAGAGVRSVGLFRSFTSNSDKTEVTIFVFVHHSLTWSTQAPVCGYNLKPQYATLFFLPCFISIREHSQTC